MISISSFEPVPCKDTVNLFICDPHFSLVGLVIKQGCGGSFNYALGSAEIFKELIDFGYGKVADGLKS